MAKTKKRSASHKPNPTGQGTIVDSDISLEEEVMSFSVSMINVNTPMVVWYWGGNVNQIPRLLGTEDISPGEDFVTGSFPVLDSGDGGSGYTELRSPSGELMFRSPTTNFA